MPDGLLHAAAVATIMASIIIARAIVAGKPLGDHLDDLPALP